jgi:addiction module RelE/StbE family toxin
LWTIQEESGVEKFLLRAPKQIQRKYEAWKRIAQELGPQGLSAIRGFRDEALAGDWKGFRSSRLSDAYRVIYSIQSAVLTVSVERVSKHDYR